MLKERINKSNDAIALVVIVILVVAIIGGMSYGIIKLVDWTNKDYKIFLSCMNDTANNDCSKNGQESDFMDWDENSQGFRGDYYYRCRGDTTRYNFTNMEEEICR